MTAAEFIAAYRAASAEGRTELQPLVAFRLQPRSSIGSPLDPDYNLAFREQVTSTLYRDFTLADLELLRLLMAEELMCERETSAHPSLYQLAYCLFRLRQPEDVFVLYEAKYGTGHMDPAVMLDQELLGVGHAPAEMLRYVEARFAAEPGLRAQCPELPARLRELRDKPEWFQSPQEYARSMADYFTDPDDEPAPQPNPNSGYMPPPPRAVRPWWKFW